MATVKNIFDFLNGIAPVEIAESYDNPGILAGDPEAEVTKALIALDITTEVAGEAAKKGAQLIISHHPVIFHPLKAVLNKGATAPLWQLAVHNLAAVCMHTNLDMAMGGVNDALAFSLSLENTAILKRGGSKNFKKISVFVPKDAADRVRLAIAHAGAGHIGAYDSCSFTTEGKGYFRPLEGSKPFIGRQGEETSVDEVRVEAVCPPQRLRQVIAAMTAAHPYEVPAYDLFDDEALLEIYGIGRIGELGSALPLKAFGHFVKDRLKAAGVRVSDSGRKAKRIAVCGGTADSEILKAAVDSRADTLVTGEFKHSLYIEARELGINVIEAGHFATENVITEPLQKVLKERIKGVEFEVAEMNTEPYYEV